MNVQTKKPMDCDVEITTVKPVGNGRGNARGRLIVIGTVDGQPVSVRVPEAELSRRHGHDAQRRFLANALIEHANPELRHLHGPVKR